MLLAPSDTHSDHSPRPDDLSPRPDDLSPRPDDLSPSASTPLDHTHIAALLSPRSPVPLPDDPSEIITACGMLWDAHDIARFLRYCVLDPLTNCLMWTGGKSKGRGKTIDYGSFWVSGKHGQRGKTVRAHKFYAVAILGHRPRPNVHQLDHLCVNSLCVRHVACVPSYINRALQWIRVQVGLDDPPDYHAEVIARLASWVMANPRSEFPEWQFTPDPFDPRYWRRDDLAD